MKKLNKKGFTLIELLATIVILGVLMTIAIVSYNGIIADSKKNGFVSSVQTYFSAAKDMFLVEGDLYSTGTSYVDIANVELEKGGTSPYGGDYKGYIMLTTNSNATSTTNQYEICITDGSNYVKKENASTDVKIEKGDVAPGEEACAIPTDKNNKDNVINYKPQQ